MLLFNPTKLIVAAACILTALGAFYYVSGIRADLAISQENSHRLESAIAQQQEAIGRLSQEQAQIKALNRQLTLDTKDHEKDLNNLRDRFDRDIGHAAIVNPRVIEHAINKGTANAARCMEIASGSPLTEAEENATTPDKINKECPSLANPNYSPSVGD